MRVTIRLLRRLIGVLLWPAVIALAWSRRRTLIGAGRQLGQLASGATPAEAATAARPGGTGPAPTPPTAPRPPRPPAAPPADAAMVAADPASEAPPAAADETLAVQRAMAERAPAGAGRPGAGAGVDIEEDAGAVGAGGTPDGAVPGDGTRECPPNHPIKGNASSMIYHAPGQASYANTIPEFCFASAEVAEAAGYRPPRR